MWYVANDDTHDPGLNLAAEEFLLRRLDLAADVIFFYVNAPSVIVGRNQNTFEEINTAFVRARGLPVLRRLSGGGAVYHDWGNLNFSFITRYEPRNFQNFRKFTAPIIETLRALGVPAELSGRSDIRVAGRKISGNAQYRSGARMLSHGTLLFNTRLEDLEAALAVEPGVIVSKALKSVRSQVANICEFLAPGMDLGAFKARLLEGLFAGQPAIPTYHFTEADWAEIRALAAARYALWDWNYGASPPFTVQKRALFTAGPVEARIEVQHGRIANIVFQGADLPGADVLVQRLIGIRYDRDALAAALTQEDVGAIVSPATLEAMLNLLGPGARRYP